MNDLTLTYITSVFSFVTMIPVIVLIYLLITKRLKLRPVIAGIFVYMTAYATSQLVLVGVNAVAGSFLKNYFWLFVALFGIITPVITQYTTHFAYQRVLTESRTWRDGMGFGLSLGMAWVITTIGTMMFFALFLHTAITDGSFDARLAEMTQEEAQQYLSTKESFLQVTRLDYLLYGISGVSVMLIHPALSVAMLLGIEKNNRIYIYAAVLFHIAMYVPFFSATLGMVNLYTAGVLLVLAIASVVFLTKTYDQMEDTTEQIPYSRPSPLLRRRHK